MRAYVALSGAVFGILAVAQVVHIAQDPEHFGEPSFIVHLLGSLALFLWSVWLLMRKSPRSPA
jgi:hypothetical protein